MASSHPSLDLSIVVPAYNEAGRIGATLTRILAWARDAKKSMEVLVVDDGSRDDTVRVVEEIAAANSAVRLLRQPTNRGKGAAVKRGMLEARAPYVLFSDADLSSPIEEVERLLPYIERGSDIVIGSRSLPDSDIRKRQPRFRETMGRTFNRIVRVATGLPFVDTQCGFKLFTQRAAQEVFAQLTVERFAFDVEMLLIAKELGFRVSEVAVVWSHAENSRVSPVVDSARMFRDVVRVRIARRR